MDLSQAFDCLPHKQLIILKSTWANIEPWGTPLYMSSHLLIILPILTQFSVGEIMFLSVSMQIHLLRMHLVYLLTVYGEDSQKLLTNP
jgi:hypothetical protein